MNEIYRNVVKWIMLINGWTLLLMKWVMFVKWVMKWVRFVNEMGNVLVLIVGYPFQPIPKVIIFS